MEPISSTLMIATGAFNAIKKGIELGQELESMGGQLGKWFTAISDLTAAKEKADRPSVFKKFLGSGSVEQEALDATIAKKKVEEMEKELRELIIYTYGIETYKEMIAMRRSIKAQRKKYAEDRIERIKTMLMLSVISALVIGLVSMLYFAFIWS